MSDLTQIGAALNRLFFEEGHRIVFWNDPEREFQNTFPLLDLPGVTRLRLDEVGALEAKLRIERLEPSTKFLLYASQEEPDYEADWLLDVRLYSRSFRADRASILLLELGLVDQSLRTYLAERRKFFDAKERLQKLKPLVEGGDTATVLDRKMMTVVTRAERPEPFELLLAILDAWPQVDGEVDLEAPPGVWQQVEKHDLDGPFWEMVKSTFSYAEENPSLKNLVLRLFVTDFAYALKGDLPLALRPLTLPRTGWSNTVVCLGHWRDSSPKGASYDQMSSAVATETKIDGFLQSMEIEHLLDVMTFLVVEKRVASGLKDRVQATGRTLDAGDVRAVATRRQAGHWASPMLPSSALVPRRELNAVYRALVAAADFFELRNKHSAGFDYPDAVTMYRDYETELFRFDQLYRQFCEAGDLAEAWGVLKPLRADLEKCYLNWYLTGLFLAWGKFMEPGGGLLDDWSLDGIPNQYRFYDLRVRPWLDKEDNRRAFVIVSDAFRAGTAEILVDGKSSIAGERDAILQAVGGMACKADELLAMKKDEGRELIKDKRVVYVFHNRVDSTGDDAKTEGETFQAVRETIEELANLVAYIVNNLNGYYIVVTADHGFLFTETPPGEPDKSKLGDRPDGTVVAKKRYLLGRQLGKSELAWCGKTSVTAHADGDMEFWIPKSSNRFHFVGGSRFVHGGAMPQEIVVPVLTVKYVRGKSAEETKTKPVAVQVLGVNHRITTGRHRFQLIQVEAVTERVKPITLKVAVYDGEEPVTNIETVTFDSASANIDERKKWINLVLQDRPYDKKVAYRLVLRDAETDVEQQNVDVVIDRAFTDDF